MFGCCRWFGASSSEYEPIVASCDSTYSKTVVPTTQEKAPLHENEKKAKVVRKSIPSAEEAMEDSIPFEQELLFNKVLVNGKVKYAAIASFPNGSVKAANFPVKKKGIKNIVDAFKGKPEGIVQGMKLSTELPIYSPGKMDKNRAIYGTAIDPRGEETDPQDIGGCTVMKSNSYVLITTYKKNEYFEQVEQFTARVIDKLIADGM